MPEFASHKAPICPSSPAHSLGHHKLRVLLGIGSAKYPCLLILASNMTSRPVADAASWCLPRRLTPAPPPRSSLMPWTPSPKNGPGVIPRESAMFHPTVFVPASPRGNASWWSQCRLRLRTHSGYFREARPFCMRAPATPWFAFSSFGIAAFILSLIFGRMYQ